MHPIRPIRIAIADDHEVFRYGFKSIVENLYPKDIEFVGQAANGIDLIEIVKKQRPELVFTDIQMPELDGIQACRIIKEKYPKTQVIALSFFDHENSILQMIQAGASGYLAKSGSKEEILDAIKTVSEGKPYYCSTISEKLFGIFHSSNSDKRNTKNINFSVHEIQVMKLICKQQTTKEIAHTLNSATRSIDDCRYNIQQKIGARNVVGIALYAWIHELVKLSELY